MSSILARSSWPAASYTSTSRTEAFALPAGTGRRLIVISAGGEATTGMTYNGAAMSAVGSTLTASGAYVNVFEYSVPDALAAGSYDFVFAFGAGAGHTYRAWVVNGTLGAVTAHLHVNASGTASASAAVALNDLLLVLGTIGNPSGTGVSAFGSTQVTTADVTGDSSASGFRSLSADAVGDAAETVSWTLTPSPGTEESAVVLVVVAAAVGGGSPALTVDEQPSATPSGYLIDPPPTVSMTTDGSTVDTSFTGDVTVELLGSGGVLLGTLTVAAVLGVAVFDDLRPCEAGSYSLRFSAAGVADLDSDPFTVTSGSGALVTGGDMPNVQLRRNEGTAALRRIYLDIEDDAGAPWAGSVTGVKAKLSQNGGSETDSPADIVRIGGGGHYVECAQAYIDIAEGSKILARVPAASGRREAKAIGEIIPSDSYAAVVSETSLTNKLVRALNGADGYIVEKDPDNGKLLLTIPMVGVVEIPCRFVTAAAQIDAIGTT